MAGFTQPSGFCWDMLSWEPSTEKAPSRSLIWLKTWHGLDMLYANLLIEEGVVSTEDASQSSMQQGLCSCVLDTQLTVAEQVQCAQSRQELSKMAHLLIWDINSAHPLPQDEMNMLSPCSKQQEKKKPLCIEISICMFWRGFIDFKISSFWSLVPSI